MVRKTVIWKNLKTGHHNWDWDNRAVGDRNRKLGHNIKIKMVMTVFLEVLKSKQRLEGDV